MKALSELVGIGLCAALVAGVYYSGRLDGYSSGTSACQIASAKAEAAAMATLASHDRAQMRDQAKAVATAQAQRTALSAALATAQARIIPIPISPDCTIGPRVILVLNSLRGERK